MGQEWVTVKEACGILGMSERTLRRHIQQGKVKSRVKDKRRYVLIEVNDIADHGRDHVNGIDDHDQDHDNVKQSESQSELVQQLRSENEYLRTQVESLQKEMSESRERSDTLILNLTRQFENSQRMIESSQMKAKRSLWSRLISLFVEIDSR